MDEKLEKAIKVSNFMATLTNQRKLALEEFNQDLIYYFNGASFTASRELITFLKTLADMGNTNTVILDDNNIPVSIESIGEFLATVVEIYTEASNKYLSRYSELKSKRRVEDLVKL